MKAVLVLLFALVAVQGQPIVKQVVFDPVGGGALSKIELQGGVNYQLTTPPPLSFSVTFKANADVKVGIGASVKVTGLPNLFQPHDFSNINVGLGVQAAFGVWVNVTGALEQVSIVSPPLPILGQEIANTFNQGVLALDEVTNPQTKIFSILKAVYDPETKRITVALPNNLPVIFFGKVAARATAQLGTGYSVLGGANQTITWDANTAITFRSNVANVITVAKTNAATQGSINALAKVGRPLNIFLNVSLATKAAHESTIRITYNAQDLINAGIKNEANLKLAFFNELTGNWEFDAWANVVNTTAHWVEGKVSHFSTWTAIESDGKQNSANSASVSIVLMAILAIRALFQ